MNKHLLNYKKKFIKDKLPNNFDVKDFSKIEENIVEEYKKI